VSYTVTFLHRYSPGRVLSVTSCVSPIVTSVRFACAGGGTRTHKRSPSPDFESDKDCGIVCGAALGSAFMGLFAPVCGMVCVCVFCQMVNRLYVRSLEQVENPRICGTFRGALGRTRTCDLLIRSLTASCNEVGPVHHELLTFGHVLTAVSLVIGPKLQPSGWTYL
jgi:hypothetical protein